LATMARRTAVQRLVVHTAAAAATGALLRQSSASAGDDPALNLPQYDADGKMTFGNGYSEETQFRTHAGDDGASVRMLGAWNQRSDGGWTDPVLGSSATSVRMRSQPTGLESTAKLGRPERVALVPALGLEKELERADPVAAAIRKVEGGEYYDFDLALPARNCDQELATACLPVKVILLSCTVTAGKLHVLQVEASPSEWRNAGKALKDLRSTFSIA